jgi:hypothetical protein
MQVAALCIVVAYIAMTVAFLSSVERNGGTNGIYGIPLNQKIEVINYFSERGINEIFTYKYIKGDYKLLSEMLAPSIKIKSISKIDGSQKGYL